jgi:hypothetical protein
MNKQKSKRNRNAKRAVKTQRNEVVSGEKINVSRSAAVSIRDSGNDGEKIFRAVLSTENKVFDLDGSRLVERVLLMDGIENLQNQLPMFDQHNPSSALHRLGSIRDIKINGNNLEGDLDFADTDDGKNAHSLYRDGHLTDVSIGAVFMRNDMRTVTPGKTLEMSGRSFSAHPKIPLQIVTRWTPIEVSAVNRGADSEAKVKRMFEQINNAAMEEKGMDNEEEEIEVKEKVEKTERKEIEIPDMTGAATKAVRAAVEIERKENIARIEAIRKEGEGIDEKIVERCINDGLSLEASRGEFLKSVRESRKSVGAPYIHIGNSGDITREAMEAGLLISASMSDVAEKEYDKEAVDRADKKLKGVGFEELCRWAIASDGQSVPLSKREVIKRAFSTVSLPVTLGNIANKSLMKGYSYAPQTWEKWCFTGEVSDFKTNTWVGNAITSKLAKVGPGGKLPNAEAAETYEQYRIHTYGETFSITREQFVNDDLGAFTQTPMAMGRDVQNNISNLVYVALQANGTLTDGYSLCGTDHDNYISGTDTVLNDTYGVGAVSAALVKFMTMKDLAGNYISVMPKYLLVPPALMSFAKNLYQSPQVLGATTTKTPNINIHAGSFEVIAEPRLSDSSYTGYSSTAWYLVADPSAVQSMGVFFLRGQRNPTIERVDVDNDTLGYKWRVYHDVGVKAVDYRGLVKSKGAAA